MAIGYGAVLAGIGVGIGLLEWRNPTAFMPNAGISVFAPLYILAQGIERLLEPLSAFIKAPSATTDPNGARTNVKKTEAVDGVNQAIVKGDGQSAANWQRVVDTVRRNGTVIVWGAASCIGIILCGLLGLFMLRMVGFTSVPKEIDVVISGLAVGSGTKPLHDLISNLQQSSTQKQDPPEKQAS